MPPGADREPTPEYEPMTIEQQTLIAFGYEHVADQIFEIGGKSFAGRNFLDAYGDSPHRQTTEAILRGFFASNPKTDPNHNSKRAYVASFLEPVFGPPITDETLS